jgi:hypothetical protein
MMKTTIAIAITNTYASAASVNLTEVSEALHSMPMEAIGTKIIFKMKDREDDKFVQSSAFMLTSTFKNCNSQATRLFRDAGKFEEEHKKYGMHLWYYTECHDVFDTYMAIDNFAKNDVFYHNDIEFIEPEFIADMQSIETKPNDGLTSAYQSDDFKLTDMYEAWGITTGDSNVVVQVVDSGLDIYHEDIADNIWHNSGEICGNGLDDDNNGYIDDCHGYNHADDIGFDLYGSSDHGTHCSGIISAVRNNNRGIAGIAGGNGTFGSGIKIMTSVMFGKTQSAGWSEAITYGADNGATISSNSWGFTTSGYSGGKYLRVAIDYFNSHNEGIVIAASGNSNSNLPYAPASIDNVISVGAVDSEGSRAYFSNYGEHTDIFAPGVSIVSLLPDDKYGLKSGTSMACPFVAGILALGKSVLNENSGVTPSKGALLSCLFSTSSKFTYNVGNDIYNSFIPNAYEFLICVKEFDEPKVPTRNPTRMPTPAPTRDLTSNTHNKCEYSKKMCKKSTNCSWNNKRGKCKPTKCRSIFKRNKCKELDHCKWKRKKCKNA